MEELKNRVARNMQQEPGPKFNNHNRKQKNSGPGVFNPSPKAN